MFKRSNELPTIFIPSNELYLSLSASLAPLDAPGVRALCNFRLKKVVGRAIAAMSYNTL
jgi:hypothetical protein